MQQIGKSKSGSGTDQAKRAEEISHTLAEFGGVLSDDRLGGVQRGFYDIIQKLLTLEMQHVDSNAKTIGFTWVNSWDVNAIAFECIKQPEIALFGGTATVLAAIASAIARSENYAPSIPGGEPTNTCFGPVAACFRRRWPKHVDTPLPSAEALFQPPSAERTRFASDLVWVGASLLMMHEAGHHRRGHVRIAQHRLGAWGIFESGANDADKAKTEASALLSQAMEVDADSHALAWTLSDLVLNAESIAAQEKVAAQCIHDVVVMLGIICSIFDYEQIGILAFRKRRHPHPAIRFLYGLREIVHWADKRELSESLIESATLHGIADLQWISNQLDWTLVNLSESRQQETDTECRRLRQCVVTLGNY